MALDFIGREDWLMSTNGPESRGDCTAVAHDEYGQLEIVLPDERNYRISLKNRTPYRIESVFGGYRGRITYREVKVGGAVWQRVVLAAGLVPA